MSEVKNKQEEAIQPKGENESKTILTISGVKKKYVRWNFRTEPDTTSESVRVANHKEVFEVISYTKSWIKVEDGWILNLPYGCVIKQK